MKLKKNIILPLIFLLMSSLPAFGSHGEKNQGSDHKEYYSNGMVKSIGITKSDGKREGKWQLYFNNGKLMAEGNYRNGIKVGQWKHWDKDGKVVSIKNYEEPSSVTEESKSQAVSAHPGDKSKPAATMEEWKKGRKVKTQTHTKKRAATMEEWKKIQAEKQRMEEGSK